jgi:hypothetical protein
METATPANGGVERKRGAQFYMTQINHLILSYRRVYPETSGADRREERRDASDLVVQATNEKTFSTRHRTTLFPYSQRPSVKLTPPGRVRDAKAIGRAGLQSLRDNARIFVGRSFSYGVSGTQRVRLQPQKYRFLQLSHRLGRTAQSTEALYEG